MTRQILIVVGIALLSACGFALILGIGWLTLHLVLGDSPYLLAARIRSMVGVLSALFIGAAIVGGGCATSVLLARHRTAQDNNTLTPHPRFRG
jgi:hypothetical protein